MRSGSPYLPSRQWHLCLTLTLSSSSSISKNVRETKVLLPAQVNRTMRTNLPCLSSTSVTLSRAVTRPPPTPVTSTLAMTTRLLGLYVRAVSSSLLSGRHAWPDQPVAHLLPLQMSAMMQVRLVAMEVQTSAAARAWILKAHVVVSWACPSSSQSPMMRRRRTTVRLQQRAHSA